MPEKKVDIGRLQEMKKAGEKITMLTAYDYPTASILDEAGVDCLLVGDSAGNVVLGYPDTIRVTMDELIMLTAAVSRAAKRAMVIGDMPFMSYNISIEDAIRNAGRFMKEAGADAVKLEGGDNVLTTVNALVKAGIPVIGHLGLTPQTAGMLGGYRVQGKTAEQALKMIEDAKRLEEAGAIMIVLELVPESVAQLLTEEISIPTIGIGAGAETSGQVLVLHDILSIRSGFSPKFVKHYANVGEEIAKAAAGYVSDVKAKTFPAKDHRFKITEEEFAKIEKAVKG